MFLPDAAFSVKNPDSVDEFAGVVKSIFPYIKLEGEKRITKALLAYRDTLLKNACAARKNTARLS